jgi:hypothetical protein
MDIDMDICTSTMGQAANDRWWKERTGRITASRFGRIMSARGDKSLQRIRDDITNHDKNPYTPPACRMGIAEEENAKAAYISYKRDIQGVHVNVTSVGLCVPNWSPRIASSPDGIVNTCGELIPHVLEIKCIYDTSIYPRSIVDVARQRGSSFYCTVDANDQLTLKKTHQYYYQVLGEMATTGLLNADFVIYHPRTGEVKVLKVVFDQEDWKKLKTKLDNFTEKYLNI